MVGVRAHESEDVRKALAVIISAARAARTHLLTHEVSLREADLALPADRPGDPRRGSDPRRDQPVARVKPISQVGY